MDTERRGFLSRGAGLGQVTGHSPKELPDRVQDKTATPGEKLNFQGSRNSSEHEGPPNLWSLPRSSSIPHSLPLHPQLPHRGAQRKSPWLVLLTSAASSFQVDRCFVLLPSLLCPPSPSPSHCSGPLEMLSQPACGFVCVPGSVGVPAVRML